MFGRLEVEKVVEEVEVLELNDIPKIIRLVKYLKSKHHCESSI